MGLYWNVNTGHAITFVQIIVSIIATRATSGAAVGASAATIDIMSAIRRYCFLPTPSNKKVSMVVELQAGEVQIWFILL